MIICNEKYKCLNLNSIIKVKLTVEGMKIYIEHIEKDYNNTIKMFPNTKIYLKKDLPIPDSDGYYSFMLWEFMNIFGSYMEMGMKSYIEYNNIYILNRDIIEKS